MRSRRRRRRLRVGADRATFDGRVTEPMGRRGGVLFDKELPAGRYRVVSFQRPCGGDCSALDPPSDRCEVLVGVRPGRTVRLAMRLGRRGGCCFRPLTQPGRCVPQRDRPGGISPRSEVCAYDATRVPERWRERWQSLATPRGSARVPKEMRASVGWAARP